MSHKFQNTHKKINPQLWGEVSSIKNNTAEVKLVLTHEMAADEYGLIHGGTIFGVADYAAMVAVNHPHVVLAKADVKFLKPCQVGDEIIAKASITNKEGKKFLVRVEVKRNDDIVFVGDFLCIIPKKHVLS